MKPLVLAFCAIATATIAVLSIADGDWVLAVLTAPLLPVCLFLED